MGMNPYYLGGLFVGGFLGVYIFSAIIEWAIIKRVMDDPAKGGLVSTFWAWVAASFFYYMNTGRIIGPVVYGIPAIVIGVWKFWRAQKQHDDDEVGDVFE